MNYLLSDKNTFVWLMFTFYAMSALFIIPKAVNFESSSLANSINSDRSLQFAARFIIRTALILPMIFIIKNTI